MLIKLLHVGLLAAALTPDQAKLNVWPTCSSAEQIDPVTSFHLKPAETPEETKMLPEVFSDVAHRNQLTPQIQTRGGEEPGPLQTTRLDVVLELSLL